VTRVLTLGRIHALFSGSDASGQTPDSSMVLRYELDVAAFRVFLNHPILGVGPGQFARYYSMDYVNRVGLRQLSKGYQAHNVYFQVLAETGLVGTACFLSIMAAIMWDLWKRRGRSEGGHTEVSLTASAFFLSLTALSIVSFFLHLEDQRYFWLMFALSSAVARILRECANEKVEEVFPVTLSPTQKLWLEAGDAPSH